MSKEESRYILIEHNGDGTVCIHSFRSEAGREAATMGAIFFDEVTEKDEHWDEWQGYLSTLREDGALRFEGDAPLEWMRGYITGIAS